MSSKCGCMPIQRRSHIFRFNYKVVCLQNVAACLYRDVATFSNFTIKSFVFKMWLHAYIEISHIFRFYYKVICLQNVAACLYRDEATFSDLTIKSYIFKMWLHAYIRDGTTITSASTPCAFLPNMEYYR